MARTGTGMGAGGLFPFLGGKSYTASTNPNTVSLRFGQEYQHIRLLPVLTACIQPRKPFVVANLAYSYRKREAPSLTKSDGADTNQKRRLTLKGNSFPLPAVKDHSVIHSSKLLSFGRCCNKLGSSRSAGSSSSTRAKVFRRLLHQGCVPVSGKTR